MIKLVTKDRAEGKKIFYLRKEDIMILAEDDDGDIEVTFKESVLNEELTIEDVTLEEIETGLDYPPESECSLIRDFY